MKKLIGFGSLFLLFIVVTAFISSEPKETVKATSLEGSWELINRYSWEDNNVADTLPNINGYRQVKIYSKGKVMWTRYAPDDANEYFGYGDYTNTEDNLHEWLEFGSKVIMDVHDTVNGIEHELQLDKDFYSQIVIDDEGNRTFSENYRRID